MTTCINTICSRRKTQRSTSPVPLRYLVPVLLLTGLFTRVTADEIDFETRIRPLLLQHCSDCHGPESQEGGLRLDVRSSFLSGGNTGIVVTPGTPEESELIRRVTSTNEDLRMPPEGPRLSAEQIQLLQRWIKAGAIWPESDYDRNAVRDSRLEHWSFQPVQRPQVPHIPSHPQATPIDAFILQKLQLAGLTMSPPADKATLLRRATLILNGLLPTPEERAAFLQNETDSAWSEVIEHLLRRQGYGERWAQHWLDVMRYADTHGFEVNTPRETAWPYRDYVIRAFNDDLPYDEFLRDQLVGDLRGEDAATGFLVCAPVLLPGQIGKDEESIRLARQDALNEMITGTGNAILGLSIGCARCHDHKFDPLSQRDYYNFQAFFSGVQYGERPLNSRESRSRSDQAKALEPRIAELQQAIDRHQLTAQPGSVFVIDETDPELTEVLLPPNGPGNNPQGTAPGYRDFPGSSSQIANISAGQYTWWNNTPGKDVLAYRPQRSGTFSLWVSWGAHGSGVHTRDARIIHDRDGSILTTDDQTEICQLDQYYPSGISTGQTPQVPLWSGLLQSGAIDLTPQSALLVRGGETGTGITADAIVLQKLAAGTAPPDMPHLRAPVSPLLNTDRITPTNARFLRFTISETVDNNRHQPCLDELEVFGSDSRNGNLARLDGVRVTSSGNYSETGIHQLRHVNDGLYGNSHSWISSEFGGGWVQLEWPQEVEIERIRWSRDRDGQFPDRLATRYSISISVDGNNWRVVADHSDRAAYGTPWNEAAAVRRGVQSDQQLQDVARQTDELQKLQQQRQEMLQPQMVYSGVFQIPEQTFLLRRGDPEQPQSETTAVVPAIFRDVAAASALRTPPQQQLTEDQRRRWQLAEWLTSPEHPLTARVMVNRIWQHHFGSGLVASPNDFGINGDSPSHPELLDWLAAEFVSHNWSIRHIQKLIMNSAVWQQQATEIPAALAIDSQNRLLWRFGSRRMEAEAIRDCMLQLTGTLNRSMGGSGFSFFTTRGGLNGFPPVEEFAADGRRRMIYSHRVRMESVPVFGAFDCPDAGQSEPMRGRSTTAIQALNLLNSGFVVQMADEMAAAVSSAHSPESVSQVDQVWLMALGRLPTQEEQTLAEQVAAENGLSAVCRAVMNSHEFLQIP